MPSSSSTMPLASHCFTLAVGARAERRKSEACEIGLNALDRRSESAFFPDQLSDLPPSLTDAVPFRECISVDAMGDIARTVSLLGAHVASIILTLNALENFQKFEIWYSLESPSLFLLNKLHLCAVINYVGTAPRKSATVLNCRGEKLCKKKISFSSDYRVLNGE